LSVVTGVQVRLSIEAGHAVDEAPFETLGDTQGTLGGPARGRANKQEATTAIHRRPPVVALNRNSTTTATNLLFRGWEVCLDGEFGLPPREDLVTIVTAGGGRVVQMDGSGRDSLQNEKKKMVCSEEDHKVCNIRYSI
jgi:hypothetical protein